MSAQGRPKSLAPAGRQRQAGPASEVEEAARVALVATVRRMEAAGLNRGSTGNASLRLGAGFLVTPTGMGSEVQPDELCWLGHDGSRRGPWAPSSEWHFHAAIHAGRPDLNVVLHTHSPNATALACLRRRLPPFHYMVAVAGGDDVPLVPYHLFGTEALSQAVSLAMRDRKACLLANHGLIAAGRDLGEAFKVLAEIEALCGSYLQALAVGEPALLSAAEMAAVQEKFAAYGRSARA